MDINTKPCLNCKEPFVRPDKKIKDEKYLIEQEQETENRYELITNTGYHNRMNEVQGLSRLYLDNKINLDTLRIMELELRT